MIFHAFYYGLGAELGIGFLIKKIRNNITIMPSSENFNALIGC
jgi:hypothetical protein